MVAFFEPLVLNVLTILPRREYMARVFYHSTSGDTADPHEKGLEGIPDWSIKLIAVVVVIIVAVMNALSAKLGTRTQVATTIVKLAGTVAFLPI